MLTALIALPFGAGLLGALVTAFVPARGSSGAAASGGGADARGRLAGAMLFLATLAALGLAIALIADYHPGAGLSHVEDTVWIRALGIHYKVGVDGLNVFLVALTTLLFAGAVLASNLREWDRPRLFYFQMGLAESAVLGAYLAQDLALFVAFFDLMLVPFYFLIGGWGSGARVQATTKLVIYTLVGSLFMLAAAIATGVLASQQHGTPLTFVLSQLQHLPVSRGSQEWIFLFFAAAFLVKMPAFPLHGWLPDGYTSMPPEVLMVFSGTLAKVGAYGFLRIVLPLFPQASVHFQLLLLLIALSSIIYGSVSAFTTTNVRLIVGYSSIAQLGFITLGIFSFQPTGAQGALLQMVNHGLVVAPLFFIIALVAARTGGSEDLRDMGGLARGAPVLAGLFLVVALATLAMPGSGNFVGEFFILLGTFQSKLVLAIIAFSGVVMASVYMLRGYIRIMHNREGPREQLRDIRFADGLVLAPLVLVIVFFALYPQLALHRSEGSAKAAIRSVAALTAKSAPAPATAAGGSTVVAGNGTRYQVQIVGGQPKLVAVGR